MHTFTLYLDSRFQNLPSLNCAIWVNIQRLKPLPDWKKKKKITMLLCKCLGMATGSSLQIVWFRYHTTQLLYPTCFNFASLSLTLVFITWLTLLKLEVCLILGSWDDVLPQNPSPNPTEHFSPGRDLSTRKSWTGFGPELVITTPIHHLQHFHCLGLIPMLPISA